MTVWHAFEAGSTAYEARFGFPFIVCVRRLTPPFVLRGLERRLANTPGSGTHRRPGRDRRTSPACAWWIASPARACRRPPAICRRTSSIPPAARRPRASASKCSARATLIHEAVTNHDGRTDAPLLADGPLRIGRYELRFHVEDYYAGWPNVTDPPWYDVIPIRFGVSEPEGHYHIPLLLGAWTYTTYRGS